MSPLCCFSFVKRAWTLCLIKKLSKAPKFAIANGLYIGELDSTFDDSTMTEHAMVNLSQPTRFMAVVQGGKHSAIRSHAYYFRAAPSPPAGLLPREVISSGTIGVTMVGCITPAQKAATMKRYNARVPRLLEQLQWYRDHNDLYKPVAVAAQTTVESFTSTTSVVLDCSREDAECRYQPAFDNGGANGERGVSEDDNMDTTRPPISISLSQHLDESRFRHNELQPAHAAVRSNDDEVSLQSATALVTNFGMEDDIDLTRQILEKSNVVVRRSSGILSDFDKAFWVYSFCELFPFGRGGLDEHRPVTIGLEEFVRYCLRLSLQRFARHPSFTLVAFDVIARQHASQAVYIRGKLSPRLMGDVATVERDQLLRQVKHLEERRIALAANTQLPPPPVAPRPVRALLSAIGTGIRAFYGSNQERGYARTKALSMQLAFGQPAIFFTLTPDCSASYRVANLAGEMDDVLLDSDRDTLQECLDFTKARLERIATGNPVACAEYFNCVMDVIIRVVLNWDTDKNCSKPGVGLFGVTKAFVSSTESQGSTGNLHGHMLIWVHGMAETVDEYYSAVKLSSVRRRLLRYVESIASSSFPLESTECPSCANGSLTSVQFTAGAFQRPHNGSSRPSTAKCETCSISYGGNEIIRELMGKYAFLHNVDPSLWSDTAAHHAIARPTPLLLPSCSDAPAKLVTCQALLGYQTHHWYHCKSCFKASRRTPAGKVCRMFFPKEAQLETKWATDGKVLLRRDIGSEYLNTFVPLINSVFKCNHDVKFLAAAEGPEKAFYMMKYTMKDQNTIENPLAIHLHAYDKAHLRLAECTDAVAAGRRCVQSMVCSMSNAQEVSAPMAALYLERQSPFYFSVEFQNIHVWSCVDAVFGDKPMDVTLSEDNSGTQFRATSLYFDYIYRPDSLEGLSMMNFSRLWIKRLGKRGLRFRPPHSQRSSHSAHLRDSPAVPCMLGKRLPDTRSPDIPIEDRESFQRAVLILFHPFRRFEDFGVVRDASVCNRFDSWWRGSAPDEARTFVARSDDYYASRELANQRADEDTERYLACIDDKSERGDSDCDSSSSDNDADWEEDPTSFADTALLPCLAHTDSIERAAPAAALAAGSQQSPSGDLDTSSIAAAELDRLIADAEAALHLREHSPATAVHHPHGNDAVFPTRVSVLAEALAGSSTWTDPASVPSPHVDNLAANASLADIALRFRLNRKQHKAFVRVGRVFLQSLLADSDDSIPQLIAFVGRPPGSGKSQVIRSLQALAESWQSYDAIRTVAFQGVAAEAANGQTIHKLFQWGVKGNIHNKRYSVEDKEKFARLKLLIMDEVSTTDAKLIGMIDIALRKLKNKPNKRFGGVHLLFVGDWLQQLPVAGHPAFLTELAPLGSRQTSSTSNSADDSSSTYLLRQRGVDAYHEINEVIMLEENMRHRGDPVWRDILLRWRFGEYRQEDIDLVNFHCYENNWTSEASKNLKAFCPILVTSNAVREDFNKLAAMDFCKRMKQPLHYFPAVVTHSKFHLSPSQRRSLAPIRSDKTGGLPMLMTLAIGLPMQCTKNVSRALHLANGTIGTVVGFQVSHSDSERVELGADLEFHFHTKPAHAIFLQLHDRSLAHYSILDALPPGTTPVRCAKHTGVNVAMSDRTFTVSVDQVPLVPAFALTTEKCQGLTVEKVVLGPLRHFTRVQPQRSSFYVAVTRVTTMLQLYLVEPLTLDFLKYFTPSRAALEETSRLHELEQLCDRRHATTQQV